MDDKCGYFSSEIQSHHTRLLIRKGNRWEAEKGQGLCHLKAKRKRQENKELSGAEDNNIPKVIQFSEKRSRKLNNLRAIAA